MEQEPKTFIGNLSMHYDNPLHEAFQIAMRNKVLTVPAAKINITTALMAEWEKNINAEIEINQHARAMSETKQLIEINRDRNITISYFFKAIDNAKNSSVQAERDAYEKLEPELRNYRKIQALEYEKKSSLIRGLLFDTEKPEIKPLIALLKLTNTLSILAEQNDSFEIVFNTRADRRVDKSVEKSAIARKRTDANFSLACDLIYASQLLCTVPDDLVQIQRLIDEMNELIAEYKIIYHSTRKRHNAPTVIGSNRAVIINYLPKGNTYRVIDIADTIVGEGISAGNRIKISVPVGVYIVLLNGVEWEKEITVK